MARRIRVRRDTAANWTTVDPVLASGEHGYETDTKLFKIGDGTSAWSALAYQLATDDTMTAALAAKAPLVSPALTGTPTVPTATTATNNTQAASTAYVKANRAEQAAADAAQYGPRRDRVAIDARDLAFDSAAPTGLSRVHVRGREVIRYAKTNAGLVVASLDAVSLGIAHWVTASVTLILSTDSASTGVARMRRGLFQSDAVGSVPDVPTVTGAGAPGIANQALPGVTDQLFTCQFGNAAVGTAGSRWLMAFDRNGSNAIDTHTGTVDLHRIILERAS
jgi:hypothetical protein